MFDNLKNMASMIGQAKHLRERLGQIKEELGKVVAEGEAGAGAVRVRVNGRFEVLGVKLDQAMLATLAAPAEGGPSADDLRMIEDLIAAAMNQALSRARDKVQAKLSEVAGGMNLPGLEDVMGS